METQNKISCPECGTEINVNELLYHQLTEQIKKEYENKSSKREKEIAEMKKEFVLEKEKMNELIETKVFASVKEEKTKLEKTLRAKLQEEASEQIKDLQDELERKSVLVKNMNKNLAEIERLKREKDELRDQITLEKETELTERINLEKSKIKGQVEEENFMKIKELEKQLADQVKLAEEMQRKIEQGSMQLQGEVQEVAIENMLRDLYVYDEVTEIKKGANGADALQNVKTQAGTICGSIYYESKRTKKFENSWLKKLKDDNRSIRADILVIVSEKLPEGEDNFFFRDGVWICSFWHVKALSMVLRFGLMQVHSVAVTQHNKESKMESLYNYLTGPEFSSQFGGILEGFKGLQDNYSNEKLKMQRLWKEREKQLSKILLNAIEFYGNIKGIAGPSIPEIKMLEEEKKEE